MTEAMDPKKKISVALVGATGAVGVELLRILSERRFPVRDLRLFASSRSVGKLVHYSAELPAVPVHELSQGCFRESDLVFFDASDQVSQRWVPHALESGAWVIDNSGHFRMQSDIPLLVPEVNGDAFARHLRSGAVGSKLIAGPNCSTVQLVLPLHALHSSWGLKRVVVSTYQSASGAGQMAMQELLDQTKHDVQWIAESSHFRQPLAWNCIPQIGSFLTDGSGCTSEEKKIQEESKKILGLPDLGISATAVRVPTLRCHAESVNIELARSFEVSEVRRVLSNFPGIVVIDDISQFLYPTGIQCQKNDAVYVGRVRRDQSLTNGLNLWVVSDNLVKGAALNAVQISELLLESLGFSSDAVLA